MVLLFRKEDRKLHVMEIHVIESKKKVEINLWFKSNNKNNQFYNCGAIKKYR